MIRGDSPFFFAASPLFLPLVAGGREGGERERNVCEADTATGCLPHLPRLAPGMEPATQARALDRESNRPPFGLGSNH